MFYHLKGTVTDVLPGMAVVECGGVGYGVTASTYTLSQLRVGAETKLYISESVREDAFDLYGFRTLAEKRCFELMLTVSGVGPKAAVSILSVCSPDALYMAVLSGNEKMLTAAPGIGKKIAQRILLELKDKLGAEVSEFASSVTEASVAPAEGDRSKLADANAALSALGYSGAECAAALKGVDLTQPLESIVREALRSMIR